jgi:hypothetical protein
MLIDVAFFGIPLLIGICFVGLALREEEARFWLPAMSILSYCAFYLVGGREVIFYLGGTLMACSMFL